MPKSKSQKAVARRRASKCRKDDECWADILFGSAVHNAKCDMMRKQKVCGKLLKIGPVPHDQLESLEKSIINYMMEFNLCFPEIKCSVVGLNMVIEKIMSKYR
jgi:hypothetical protein